MPDLDYQLLGHARTCIFICTCPWIFDTYIVKNLVIWDSLRGCPYEKVTYRDLSVSRARSRTGDHSFAKGFSVDLTRRRCEPSPEDFSYFPSMGTVKERKRERGGAMCSKIGCVFVGEMGGFFTIYWRLRKCGYSLIVVSLDEITVVWFWLLLTSLKFADSCTVQCVPSGNNNCQLMHVNVLLFWICFLAL